MAEVITDNLDLWTSALLTKSTAGRGSNGKLEAYGIKKLRELILELAVRGKLVPQDPSDEPANVLLSKNAKQRARLEKEGTIRKQKEFPEIQGDEKKFPLPGGWEWVKLGELMEMFNGRAFKQTEWGETGLPIIRIQNLNDPAAAFNYFDGELAEQHLVQDGTFLISWSGTPGTSFGAFVWKRGKAALNQHINKCLVFLEDVDLEYLRLSVNSCMDHLISSAQGGVGLKHVTRDTLNNIVFGYPPLAEQHRIVAKVDELMALCDQLEQQQTDSLVAHQTLVGTLLGTLTRVESQQEFSAAWARIADHFDTLFTTEASIDQLKQTILQLAVMGRLVPQDPNDEPANALLKKIRNIKEQLVRAGKLKKQTLLPEIGDDEKLFELPTGWAWARLQEVIDVRDGTHDSPKDAFGPDTYPLVTSRNFVDGEIDFDSARRISATDHFEIAKRSAVEKFDILFSMIGGNLGNQVMVKDERQFSVKNVALFKYYSKALTSPFFVKKYMEHLAFDLQERAIGGAQPFVSLGFLRNLVVALPPMEEQHRIVAKVDELMALCDALKARLADAQAIQLHLADAIVEQAVC